MRDSQEKALSPEERQATVDRLCAHFARDAMNTTELERRLDIAYAARTRAELVALERDLPALRSETRPAAPEPRAAPESPPAASVAVDPARPVQEHDLIVSIWGATERKGSWVPPRQLTAVAVMGGTDLDFRQAAFATETVSVRLLALMGGVDIVVPPGVRVEWGGIALMGGVTMPEPVTPPAADAPVLRLSGLVCMGGVDVVERHPGESARDARKRIRKDRKARRRLASGD
ncbi:MAG: DUF1707 domain-containing protein [Gemmatimonadota bacterium]|uniref:DUF1707 SHOCT-like domain-containing protein n=1 Tax=Candidatus Palauibacter scopulicola TaxID=3056741 RepID=UPI002399E742|nr:DUF1707 domain-containing protein [Candidatus Palauibacter scopulicola]MDE2662780.1 DUF1707 domain-containing protein [Candidatus Palauibacter scopulicola]